ncbi:MAG TPA: hypothetical protein VK717_03010 [Opitutaceae bacterium]|jgi:hypothetical protein|nr:hypothetical protein [Opitutaceae bacterium]
MKKFIIGSALLFAALFVLMFGLAEVRHARQLAIIAVLDQASKAKIQTKKLKDGRTLIIHPNNPQFSLKVYTQQLSQIPTVQCPEPFQLAWLNYVQTWERSEAPFAGVGSAIEFTVSTVKPNGDAAKDALARLDKMNPNEAWMRVQVVALRYGVQIH